MTDQKHWLNLWRGLLIAFGFSLIIWVLLIALDPGIGGWGILALTLLLALVVGAWLRMTSTAQREERLDPGDEAVFRYEKVPPSLLERINRQLVRSQSSVGSLQERIKASSRQDRVFLYIRTAPADLAALFFACPLVAWLLGWLEFPPIIAVALVGLIGVCLLARWMLALGWRVDVASVTNISVLKIKLWPSWLPKQPDPERHELDKINEVNPIPSWVGTLVGRLLGPGHTWGDIELVMNDREPVRLPRIKNFMRFYRVIEQARNEYALEMSGREVKTEAEAGYEDTGYRPIIVGGQSPSSSQTPVGRRQRGSR